MNYLDPRSTYDREIERDQPNSSWLVQRNAGESLSEGVNLRWDQPVAGLPGREKIWTESTAQGEQTNDCMNILQTTEGRGHLTSMTFCNRPWSVLPHPRWLEHHSFYQAQLLQKEQRKAMENFPSKIISESIFLANPEPH